MGRISIVKMEKKNVKMAILTKGISIFNTNPIKISMTFFRDGKISHNSYGNTKDLKQPKQFGMKSSMLEV
jgi:hypothetical protein